MSDTKIEITSGGVRFTIGDDTLELPLQVVCNTADTIRDVYSDYVRGPCTTGKPIDALDKVIKPSFIKGLFSRSQGYQPTVSNLDDNNPPREG